jgi:uncharacterized protein YdaU (DUF1376 family)
MANNKMRPPPSYQEYASDLLANRHYMLMSLSEHGLFDVMRKQCWVNKSVPTDKEHMAKIIGCKVSEVEANLSPHVLHFFIEKDGEYISPELDDYRHNLEERHRRISEGGKKGGEITQAKNKGRLRGNLKALRRDEQSGDDLNGREIESLENDVNENSLSDEAQEFVDEMNQEEEF